MITFQLTRPDGSMREVEVKDYDDLLISDWRALDKDVIPEGMTEEEANRELLARHTGMTMDEVYAMKPGMYDKAMEVIAMTVSQAMQARVGGPDFDPPPTIEHEGVTYAIPQDIEQETTIGQWIDLKAGQDETRHDIMVRTLAVLLVPVGKQYQGDYASRLETMERMKLKDAFHISAFFLSRSERYQKHISHSFNRLLTWSWHRRGQEHMLFLSGTASGA